MHGPINIKNTVIYNVLMRQGSLVGMATTLRTVRSGGHIPVDARVDATVQSCPGTHPACCTVGNVYILNWVMRPGRGVNHPLHLEPRLKEE
jgi:hypothetical protein